MLYQPPKTQTLNLALGEGAGPSGPTCSGFGVVVVVAGLDWTPLRRTAQNFARFSPLPPPCRRGFTRQPESPNVHTEGLRRFKHHQNSTSRHPDRHKKSEMVAGEGNKSAKFWPPHPSGPHPSGPHPSGPHPSGPHPSRAPPFGAHFFQIGPAPFGATPLGVPPFEAQRGPDFGQSRSIKVGQSRFGQSRSNKDGQSRFGQSRFGQSRSQPSLSLSLFLFGG